MPDPDQIRSRDEVRAAQHGFVWPPRKVNAPPAANTDSAPSIDLPAPPPRGLWAEIEHTWLGLTAAPLRDRCRDLGWKPDTPRDYCWKCGQSAGEFAVGGDGCSHCEDSRRPWERLVRLGSYQQPLDAWIRETKFTAFRRLGTDLGHMLGTQLAAVIREARVEGILSPETHVAVVPVPTSFRRRLARGIDHPTVIAKAVAAAAKLPLQSDLSRGHRPPQVRVSTAARRQNVAGTMKPSLGGRFRSRGGLRLRPSPRADQSQTLLILVDDVTTTGATLREAARACRDLWGRKTRIWCAVLAVTPVRNGPSSVL